MKNSRMKDSPSFAFPFPFVGLTCSPNKAHPLVSQRASRITKNTTSMSKRAYRSLSTDLVFLKRENMPIRCAQDHNDIIEVQSNEVSGDELFASGVVQVITSTSYRHPFCPWMESPPEEVYSVGFFVSDREVITTAHALGAICHNVEVCLKYENSLSKRFPARVKQVCHELDVAVLIVDENVIKDADGCSREPFSISSKEFFLKNEHVQVLSYSPEDSSDIYFDAIIVDCSMISYKKSGSDYPAIRLRLIDAVIEPGSSGSPILLNHEAIGILHQSTKPNSTNEFYAVPGFLINQFLSSLKSGRDFTGIASLPVSIQSMTNANLRAFYGMTQGQSGVLLNGFLEECHARYSLQCGDIIQLIAGKRVLNHGKVEGLDGHEIGLGHYVATLPYDKKVNIQVLRKNAQVSVDVLLQSMVEYHIEPDLGQVGYSCICGLVFTKLSYSYLNALMSNGPGDFPHHILQLLTGWNHKALKHAEAGTQPSSRNARPMIVLSHVFLHPSNAGYESLLHEVLRSINGVPISSLETIDEIRTSYCDKTSNHFTKHLQFEFWSGKVAVFETENVVDIEQTLLEEYGSEVMGVKQTVL